MDYLATDVRGNQQGAIIRWLRNVLSKISVSSSPPTFPGDFAAVASPIGVAFTASQRGHGKRTTSSVSAVVSALSSFSGLLRFGVWQGHDKNSL